MAQRGRPAVTEKPQSFRGLGEERAKLSGVPTGRLLIIEPDEWEANLLADCLTEVGYEVHLATEASAGLERVRALEPDCILCDVSLPDIDGFWVARRVRTEPSRVATTPFLFLTNAEDTESHLEGLNVGADLYLTRPYHHEEVVAQVGALIEMANRLRKQRASFSEAPSSVAGAAFVGDIAQMSVATVLTLLELERRSGQLELRSEARQVAALELNEGMVVGATLGAEAREATQVLREMLRWRKGRFSFRGSTAVLAKVSRQSVGGLLIEAMRLEDEAAR